MSRSLYTRTMWRALSLLLSFVLACTRNEPQDHDEAGTGTGDEFGEGSCEDVIASDQAGPEITLALVNTRTEPVYVENLGACSFVAFEIVDSLTDQSIRWQRTQECEAPCSDPYADCLHCAGQGPCNIYPGPIMIAPGGRYEVPWTSMRIVSVPLPDGCVAGDSCAASCSLGELPAEGSYTLRAMISGTCNGACACTANADGWCSLTEDSGVVDAVQMQTAFDYPDAPAVELVLR
jgi:hypothetical protein